MIDQGQQTNATQKILSIWPYSGKEVEMDIFPVQKMDVDIRFFDRYAKRRRQLEESMHTVANK